MKSQRAILGLQLIELSDKSLTYGIFLFATTFRPVLGTTYPPI